MRSRQKRIAKEFSNAENRPILTAIIESLDQEGRGVARLEGKAIFIDGALPGEKVTYKITREKPSFAFADVVEILKPSNLRVTPQCKHFGVWWLQIATFRFCWASSR